VAAELTQEYLKSRLHYNPETGDFTWLYCTNKHKSWNTKFSGKAAGCFTPNGYRVVKIDGQLYYGHRLAWIYMTGETLKTEIDHRDTNPSNCKWDNLRSATRQQNQRNKRAKKLSATGLKGVTRDGRGPGWVARIFVDGKRKYLGYFKTEQDAHSEYVAAAKEYFGEFARAS
jgi:HNH endonuclease/AP2 domain